MWRNAYELRRLIYSTSKNFPISEFRRVSQMNDAARSIKQNIQEGYGRSLGEYIRYLVISKGSLAELSGDIEDCCDDGLINGEQFEILNSLAGRTDFLLMRLIQSLRRKQNS